MSLIARHLRLLEALRDNLWEIQEETGEDWTRFRDVLIRLLSRILREEEENIFMETRELMEFQLPASIKKLLRPTSLNDVYRAPKPLGEQSLRGAFDPVEAAEKFPLDNGFEAQPGPVTEESKQDILTMSRALLSDLKATETDEKHDITVATTHPLPGDGKEAEAKEKAVVEKKDEIRYFNTFFTEPDARSLIGENEALFRDHVYDLCVEIRPERRGPSDGNDIFVDGALAEIRKKVENIPLLVVAASRDFEIKPQVSTIDLPPEGPSSTTRFSVRPRFNDKRGIIQVEIFYMGHLLQSKRVEAFAYPAFRAANLGNEAPLLWRPAQIARITFTTTDRFASDTISLIPERLLTIDVERDERDGSVDLRFLDRTNSEEELAYYDTTLEPQALGEVIAAVREQLKAAIDGEQRDGKTVGGYKWILDGSDELLKNWLPSLADTGRSLYRALLPESQRGAVDEGGRLKAAMLPGAVVQINPIAGKVTIPWALLYERPVLLIEGQTRVCEKYVALGSDCPDCESLRDPTVICPFAFWGYRYAIEQLPCWVGNELPQPLVLLRSVSNGRPLVLNLNVWEKFSLWKAHIDKLAAAGNITTLLAKQVRDLSNTWRQHGEELDVLYFYTHGGIDKRQPYLEVSDGKIMSNFLDAFKPNWPHHPLVFLNGCSTGEYGPESFVSLIDDFRKAGASGVIGTECAVPEMFAESYASALFPRLFKGERLGQAMLEIRREFLIKRKNPMALLYSLYASSEISLANPVTTN